MRGTQVKLAKVSTLVLIAARAVIKRLFGLIVPVLIHINTLKGSDVRAHLPWERLAVSEI